MLTTFGKFNTVLDSYVYDVSCDGGCDEEAGGSDTGRWYGLMRNGRTIFRDHDPMLETLTEAEQEMLTESAGVILTEDSQGFVYVEYFDTKDQLEDAWSAIEAEQRELEADDEDAEPSEPAEDDITTENHETFYQGGKLVLELAKYPENGHAWQARAEGSGIMYPLASLAITADYRTALRAYMELTQFWPNCWFISDHGNAHLMDLTDKG